MSDTNTTTTAPTVTLEKVGARIYLVGLPFGRKDEAKSRLGMTGDNFDRDRKCWWVGAAKRTAAEAYVAEINAAKPAPTGATATAPAQESDDRRVYAKVEYKGRSYYVVAESHANNSCRICLLSGPGFWVKMDECKLVKTYAGREVWDGRRGNGTVTKYTTLGSIRLFIADQREMESKGVPTCPVCGKRNDAMVLDHETGMRCCRGCADMPAD